MTYSDPPIWIVHDGTPMHLPTLTATEYRDLLQWRPSQHPGVWGPSACQAPAPLLAVERILDTIGAYGREAQSV
jgi:hypothetical protein